MTIYIVVNVDNIVCMDWATPKALSFTSKERAEKWIDKYGPNWGDNLRAIPLVTVKMR